jgi:hypothetical protein
LPCHLIGADADRVAEDGGIAGMAFETFAATEIRRQVAWQDNAPRQFHYRDRDGREVDVVLERRDGSVVAGWPPSRSADSGLPEVGDPCAHSGQSIAVVIVLAPIHRRAMVMPSGGDSRMTP